MPTAEKVLQSRLHQGIPQMLIKWKNQSSVDNSWEDVATIHQAYPSLQLEDKLLQQEGSDVVSQLLAYNCKGLIDKVAG